MGRLGYGQPGDRSNREDYGCDVCRSRRSVLRDVEQPSAAAPRRTALPARHPRADCIVPSDLVPRRTRMEASPSTPRHAASLTPKQVGAVPSIGLRRPSGCSGTCSLRGRKRHFSVDLAPGTGVWSSALGLLEPQSESRQVHVGLGSARIAVGKTAKPSRVGGLDEVGQLVNQHGVQHPARHHPEAVRDPDLPGARGARAPPALLIVDPANRSGAHSFEVTVCKRCRTSLEVFIRSCEVRTLGQDPPDQAFDELDPVGSRKPGREHDHHSAVLPEGARCFVSARACSYFDRRSSGTSSPAALHVVIMA
jgi:hypothetical protein